MTTTSSRSAHPAVGWLRTGVSGALLRLTPTEIVTERMYGAAAGGVLLPVSAARAALVMSSPHRVVTAELVLLGVLLAGVFAVASAQWNDLPHAARHPRIGEYFCPRQRLTLRSAGRVDSAWVLAGTLDPPPSLGSTIRLHPAWSGRRRVRSAERLAGPEGPVASRIRIDLPTGARIARYVDRLGVAAAVLAVVVLLVP
jgi:hypothetical protein